MSLPESSLPARIEEIRDFARFSELKNAWDALCSRAWVSYPMLTHAWLDSWWQAFGAGCQMRVLAVWRGTELAGAAPFLIRTEKMFGRSRRVLAFFSNSWVDRMHVLVAEQAAEVIESLIDHLVNSPREFDLISLEPLDAAEQSTTLLTDALRRRFHVHSEQHLQSPYLSLPRTWEEIEQGLSSSFRQTMRRKVRKVEAMPGVEMRVRRDASCFADVEAVSLESWQQDEGTSMASTKQIRDFYLRIFAAAAADGTLRCAVMRVDGEPAAFEFNLTHRTTLHNFKLGFRKKYAELSTGIVLKAALLRDAISGEDGKTLREYDFMGTNEAYKLNWAKAVRSHVRLMAFPRTSLQPMLRLHLQFKPFVKARLPGLTTWLRATIRKRFR